MASQHNGREKENWEMTNMCKLHKSEQSLPKGLFPLTSERSIGGCDSMPSLDELFGRLPRLPLDALSSGQLGKDCIPYAHWELPLQSNALWIEKRRVHLQKNDDQNV